MDVVYKFLVEENVPRIKERIPAQEIADRLYEVRLIDQNEYRRFDEKLTNEEGFDLILKNLSQHDVVGDRYKRFVEEVLRSHCDDLYKFLQEKLDDGDWLRDKYKSRLNFGDFPRKPAHYVERSDKITQVQDCLKRLSTIGKVILCGMTGSGKTSLVMGIMTQEIVLDTFAGNVFWITVGDVDDEQLLMLLSRFYHKLSDDPSAQENNTLFSSIDVVKDKIKKKIRENCLYARMLVVLDNVCDRKVIEAFDVGCKALVTTQNKEVWSNDAESELIEVDGSFKFDETCDLFAKCLEKPVEEIRHITEVYTIHELCQGHPFSIALFGSQIASFKHKLADKHSKMWKSLIETLQKNYSNKQNTVISSCIETLDEDIREKYSDFAIFPSDVNISSRVLQIMWGLTEYEVTAIMKKLENKSLIVSYYNYDLHNYIYGIHVVLLTYLKNRYQANLKDKHLRLISSYKKTCDGDFSRLTNDNYIYQYIGYHLKRSESVSDFKIYFDLKFIGAKIKATGIGDLLKDFNLYRPEIEGPPFGNNKQIIVEIEKFVKKFGDDMHKYEDLSIIQCALKYSEDSFIYKTAMEVAKNSPSSLYFKINIPVKDCDDYVAEFKIPENCTFVCFGKEERELLIGTKEGVIEMWDRIYGKITCRFIGHTQDVKYVELDPERESFLSVSEDGAVNLYKLRLRKADSTPSLVQTDHKTFFGEDHAILPSFIFTPEENDAYTSASFCNDYPNNPLIATGSRKGGISIHNGGNVQRIYMNKDAPIENLRFSQDDSLILGNCADELFIFTSDFKESIFENVDDPVMGILIVDDDSFVTIHETCVISWKFVSKRIPGDQLPTLKRAAVATSVARQKFSCAFIDEGMLYVVTTDHRIIFFDLEDYKRVKSANTFDENDCITAVDVYPLYTSNDSIFLLRYKNNILKVYNGKSLKHIDKRHRPIFDSYWTDRQLRLATVTSTNAIRITNNNNILNELDNIERAVTTVTFPPTGDALAIGLDNGEVIEYEIKTNQRRATMRLPSSVSLLRYFRDDLLVAAGRKGDLMMRLADRNECLIANSELSKMALEPIVEIFSTGNLLLTVNKDRVIKAWNLQDRKMRVLKGRKQSHVTHAVRSASVSKDFKLMALTMADVFDLFAVEQVEGDVNLVNFGGVDTGLELCSCNFSGDGRFLAIGSAIGVIIIYVINIESSSYHEYARLHSHVSAVRSLQFAPNRSELLVSVGEQIVWWNLAKVAKNSMTRNRRSRRNRPSSDLSVRLSESLSLSSHPIGDKVGSEGKPHLLRAVKLKGSYADSISFSPNFRTFVTKDNEGVEYVMEIIE